MGCECLLKKGSRGRHKVKVNIISHHSCFINIANFKHPPHTHARTHVNKLYLTKQQKIFVYLIFSAIFPIFEYVVAQFWTNCAKFMHLSFNYTHNQELIIVTITDKICLPHSGIWWGNITFKISIYVSDN